MIKLSKIGYRAGGGSGSARRTLVGAKSLRPGLRENIRGPALRWILLVGLMVGAGFRVARAADDAAPRWASLYAFGDSFSDSGAGYVDGDGPTAIAYAAQQLGLDFVPANDPATGNRCLNFAVSGAQTGRGEGHWVKSAFLGLGMHNQVEDFVARVTRGDLHFDPAQTLFFIAGGLNDKSLETATTVANLTWIVHTLHAAGARHFFVAILPTSIPSFAEVGRRLNPALVRLPAQLRAELSPIDIRTSRWGEYFDAIMAEPKTYGILNTTDACAGREIFDQDTMPRGDPTSYYFYHSNHPSTAVHRHVADRLVAEFLAPLPAGN